MEYPEPKTKKAKLTKRRQAQLHVKRDNNYNVNRAAIKSKQSNKTHQKQLRRRPDAD